MNAMPGRLCAVATLAATASAVAAPASAQYTFNVDYFRVTAGGDFQSQCCGTFTNMVQGGNSTRSIPTSSKPASSRASRTRRSMAMVAGQPV